MFFYFVFISFFSYGVDFVCSCGQVSFLFLLVMVGVQCVELCEEFFVGLLDIEVLIVVIQLQGLECVFFLFFELWCEDGQLNFELELILCCVEVCGVGWFKVLFGFLLEQFDFVVFGWCLVCYGL